MDIFIWRDSFNTGHNIIDCQHKKLVMLINELFTSLGESNNNAKIESVFDELCKYTVEHFSVEEQLMQDKKYPNYNSHKAEHDSFTKEIFSLKDKFTNHNQQAAIEAINFLKDWLLNHIIGRDRRIFDYINKRGSDKG
jgi:hemerythrin-like metal-binding protein